jgi:hypothetical protein
MIPGDNPIPALLEFVFAWVTGLSAKHRIAASQIPSFVPPPLRAIYELTGNWPIPYTGQWRPPRWVPGLFGRQDHLLPPDQLVVTGERFTFIHENQGVWSCETLTNEANPPVFSDAFTMDQRDEGMREICPALAHFLTTFCFHELTFGSRYLFCPDSEPWNPSELVNGDLKPLWLDGMYAYKGLKYSFFIGDRDLMIMRTGMAPNDYWIACNKEEVSKLLGTRHELRRIHSRPPTAEKS